MNDERIATAEQLAAEIFGRTMSAWNAVHTFRWMGQLGLPYAREQADWRHKETTREYATAEEYANLFRDGGRERLGAQGFFEKAAEEMTKVAVSTFEAISDAAALIFAHSVLDGAVLDWCRVCATAEPNDFLPYIEKRRVALSNVKQSSFFELRDTEIEYFLRLLEKESLIKKLDIVFELCRPPRYFAGMRDYRYDRDRIIALDQLRHDYVHRGILGVRLPRGDDDLSYLFKTTHFLLPLVNQRYGIRLDPNLVFPVLGDRPKQ
jgi:hypothetical protein